MKISKITKKFPLIHNKLYIVKQLLVNSLYANIFLKIILTKVIKKIATKHYRFLIEFYSRYNHGRALFKGYFAWLIFYALIDPEIKENYQNAYKFQNLLFKTQAALEWSVEHENNFEYYLKNENSSCLPEIMKLINSSNKCDWKLLELGCGAGNCIFILQNYLDKKIQLLDGVDHSSFAISYAQQRFNNKKHNFFAADMHELLSNLPESYEWRYDIVYAHLALQYFTEKYLSGVIKLIKEKKVAKRIFISDSYCNKNIGLTQNKSSIYNPDRHGYLRFDHNYYELLSRCGWSIELLGDHRNTSGFLIVSAKL